MKILFNNIGNRHLRYSFEGTNAKGDTVTKNLYNEKYEFKKITQQLEKNYLQEKDKIQLEILRQYLDNQKNNLPDKIILFGTDQEKTATNPFYTNQDTYWAALIIKKIIEEKYNIPVEVCKIEQNPSDENELFPVYQKILKEIILNLKNNHPDANWIFLDAGGTPQQKLVCKLLMPEINEDKTQIDYIGNVEGIDKNDLIQKSTDQLQKFFTKKAVKQLIKKGHYQSAYELLRSVEKNPALPFIKIGKLRMQNIQKGITGEFSKPDRKDNPVVLQYIQQIPCINLPELEEQLTKKDYFIYGEFIARTYLYYKHGFNNQFILSFQQSCEVLSLYFLWQYAQNIGKEIKKNIDGIGELLKDKFNEDRKDLSVQYKVILQIAKEEKLNEITQLFTLLASINNSYHLFVKGANNSIEGLDSLRNKVAHEAKAIEKIPKNIKQAFEELIKILQLNTETYEKLNQEIKKRLF